MKEKNQAPGITPSPNEGLEEASGKSCRSE